jgi:hypothetical protein
VAKGFFTGVEDVVNPSKALSTLKSSDVFHHIKRTRPLISSHFGQLDGEKLAAARKEFDQLEKDSIVCHSDSPWSSPLQKVEKAAVWRFSAAEPGDRAELLPPAQHT